MTISAVIMMMLGLGVTWGGAVLCIFIVSVLLIQGTFLVASGMGQGNPIFTDIILQAVIEPLVTQLLVRLHRIVGIEDDRDQKDPSHKGNRS